VLATLDFGDGYARYLLQPPDPAASTVAAACFSVDPDADEGWFAIRFDEARILTRLADENLGRVLELEAFGRVWWHLSAYPHGETVEAVLAHVRYGGAPPGLGVVLSAFADLAEGLQAAHAFADDEGRELGICHRDLTPAALLLTAKGKGMVVDWGLGDLVHSYCGWGHGLRSQPDDDLYRKRLRERMCYAAPEQMRGLPSGGRADVWALGLALHEILTCRNVFLAETDFATVRRVLDLEAPRPSTLVHGLPPEIDLLVGRALTKDPSARITAGDLAAGLRALLASRGAGEGRALVAEYLRELSRQGG
jgi:serine/threonine-protein kinase